MTDIDVNGCQAFHVTVLLWEGQASRDIFIQDSEFVKIFDNSKFDDLSL